MITGGTGSFGNAVLNRFLETDIGEIRIFSRDEKKQDDMRHEFQAKMPKASNKIKSFIGEFWIGGKIMTDVWENIFKKYIADFHAIDKLQADNIIEDEDTYKLKNKLLVDIICTFESEVNE